MKGKLPRAEQETILIYSPASKEWEFFSDYSPHIRKWRDAVDAEREEFYDDGSEKVLEGVINGSVSIRRKREMSDAQREALSERMKKLHATQD